MTTQTKKQALEQVVRKYASSPRVVLARVTRKYAAATVAEPPKPVETATLKQPKIDLSKPASPPPAAAPTPAAAAAAKPPLASATPPATPPAALPAAGQPAASSAVPAATPAPVTAAKTPPTSAPPTSTTPMGGAATSDSPLSSSADSAVQKPPDPAVVEKAQTHVDKDALPAAAAAIKNPDEPKSQETIATNQQRFAVEYHDGDPSKVNDPGFYGKAMGAWDNMGPYGQLAFMAGVPAALIGLLGGGGLQALLGGLGVGALGLGAGAAGFLGDKTQVGMFGALNDSTKFLGPETQAKMLGQAAQVGNFFGAVPDVAVDADKLRNHGSSPEAQQTQDQLQHLAATGHADKAQQILNSKLQEVEKYVQMYNQNPERAAHYVMQMHNGPKTLPEAHAMVEGLVQQYHEMKAPDYLKNQAAKRYPIVGPMVMSDTGQKAIRSVTPYAQRGLDFWNGLSGMGHGAPGAGGLQPAN